MLHEAIELVSSYYGVKFPFTLNRGLYNEPKIVLIAILRDHYWLSFMEISTLFGKGKGSAGAFSRGYMFFKKNKLTEDKYIKSYVGYIYLLTLLRLKNEGTNSVSKVAGRKILKGRRTKHGYDTQQEI